MMYLKFKIDLKNLKGINEDDETMRAVFEIYDLTGDKNDLIENLSIAYQSLL